ncbi:MAG: BamA/TamA family outer membrane protein, partial [Vicinamibacterales bacterium]
GADAQPEQAEGESGWARMRGWQERGESFLDAAHRRGVYPEVGSIVSGSGAAGGIGLRYPSLGGSRFGVELEGMWSVRGYYEYGARFGLLGGWREALELDRIDTNLTSLFDTGELKAAGTHAIYLEAVHRRFPQLDFFGLASSVDGVKTDFAASGPSLDLVAHWQPTSEIGLVGRIGVIDLDIGTGTNDSVLDLERHYAPVAAPALDRQIPWLAIGLAGGADSRNSVKLPTTGGFVAAAIWQLESLEGESQEVPRGMLDVRFFQRVFSDRHVAAVRILTSADYVSNGGRTPFYLQYWLGGSHTLRGYSSYRFRGQAIMHVTAEYRWRVAPMFDVVPFIDIGSVGERPSELLKGTIHASPGAGLWARGDDRFYFRIDWSHGQEGHRFLWSLSPSF